MGITFKKSTLPTGKEFCLQKEDSTLLETKEFIETMYKYWINTNNHYNFTVLTNTKLENFEVPYRLQKGALMCISEYNIIDKDLIQKTKNDIEKYPDVLTLYKDSVNLYEAGVYSRNSLDNIRLAFEKLLKYLLNNNKSLEKQINTLGDELKKIGIKSEIRNMVHSLTNFFTKYQNNYSVSLKFSLVFLEIILPSL